MSTRAITKTLPVCTFLALQFLYCATPHARNLYTIESANSSTSDDIDLSTYKISYINNRRSYFWPYEEAADSSLDWGVVAYGYNGETSSIDFTGRQLELEMGWRYSDNGYFGGKVGVHQLEAISLNSEDERLTYEVSAKVGVGKHIKLDVNAAEDYVYTLGLQPAGVEQFLYAEMRQVSLEWKPIESIRVIGSGSRWDLSDKNTRKSQTAKLLFGKSSPWIWFGISYEELNYDEIKPGYWSPHQFRSASVELESSISLTSRISVSLSGSVSRIKENSFPEGDGDSVFAGIDYSLIDNFTLRVGASRIRSQQMSSSWSEDAYRFSINGAF